MSTESFRRHTRGCVDAAIHCALAQLPHPTRAAFERLRAIVRARSPLLDTPPLQRRVIQIDALCHLARVRADYLVEPEGWPGADGHPLAVVDSLAHHLLARYPVPRFLAAAWLAADTAAAREHQGWFIAFGRGARFRDLALPVALTRRMEHVFLQTRDHVAIEHALRRAEVIGLGGSEALAAEVCASRLGESFTSPASWRAALRWLVRWEAEIDRVQVRPIIDYLHAYSAEPADGVLRGRTPASLARLVEAWHLSLLRIRGRGSRSWPRSPWRELLHDVPSPGDDQRRIEWRLIELLDNAQLSEESRAMHHCVATYLSRCLSGHSTIWSLRRRVVHPDGASLPRSMLTIEIDPRCSTIVQVRGFANQRASGQPLELVRGWAARENLRWAPTA
jgi:hypothetical protein